MLTNKIGGVSPLSPPHLNKSKPRSAKGPSFEQTLQQLVQESNKPAQPTGLKFSNHAVERMRSRGVQFSPEQLKGIEEAVGRARGKGAKDTLVLSDDSALIVSVKNNTVVTIMDRANMRENVFTNIDSTVFA